MASSQFNYPSHIYTERYMASSSFNTNPFITDSFTVTGTVNPNSAGTLTANVEKAGYTPIGIISIFGDNSYIDVRRFGIIGNTAELKVWNTANTALTVNSMTIRVLYKST